MNTQRLVATAVVVAIGLCSCQRSAVNREARTSEMFPEAQAEVTATLQSILRAAETKDIATLDSYHLYGPKFTKFDDWEPLDRQDSVAAQKAEDTGIAALKSFRPTVSDLKVDVFENVAIATFILKYTLDDGQSSVSTRARSTMVFVRDGPGWKIVHEHHSAFKANP